MTIEKSNIENEQFIHIHDHILLKQLPFSDLLYNGWVGFPKENFQRQLKQLLQAGCRSCRPVQQTLSRSAFEVI